MNPKQIEELYNEEEIKATEKKIKDEKEKYYDQVYQHILYLCHIIHFMEKTMLIKFDPSSNEYKELTKFIEDLKPIRYNFTQYLEYARSDLYDHD